MPRPIRSVPRSLSILWLEPHAGGSHRAIVEGVARHSRHRLTISTLPARNWKWRLRSAGLLFARRHESDWSRHDLVVASSLMNLADVAAGVRGRAPLLLYMHESQLSYPAPASLGRAAGEEAGAIAHPAAAARAVSRRHAVTIASGTPPRDWGLLFADLASAAAADRLLFNSQHHRRAFLRGARELLAVIPDGGVPGLARSIAARSAACPPGFEDADIPEPSRHPRIRPGETRPAPLILWNHRWEFDKSPDVFFAVLARLKERGVRFRLALLGESARVVPKAFLRAREQFREEIVQYGFVRRRCDYVRFLSGADLIVSTARHENFGLSWLEAMAAGAWPLLPGREAYPELLPRAAHAAHLYESAEELRERLERLLFDPAALASGRILRSGIARRWAWRNRIEAFDRALDGALPPGRPKKGCDRDGLRGGRRLR